MEWLVMTEVEFFDVRDEGHIDGDSGVVGGLHVDKISGHHVDKWSFMLEDWVVGSLLCCKWGRCYSGLWIFLWPWYHYQQWWQCRQRRCHLPGRVKDGDDDEVGCQVVSSLHVVNDGGVEGFGVTQWRIRFWCHCCCIRLNSQDYFAKFFIKEICALGEFLHYNVKFVERLRIRSPRIFFGFEIVDGFSLAATGIVVMMKGLYEMWRIGV